MIFLIVILISIKAIEDLIEQWTQRQIQTPLYYFTGLLKWFFVVSTHL